MAIDVRKLPPKMPWHLPRCRAESGQPITKAESFRAIQERRAAYGVPNCQADADFRRSRERFYFVRPAVSMDDERFAVRGERTEDWIAILARNRPGVTLLRADENYWGPVVNSPAYARMRLDDLAAKQEAGHVASHS
jgi:hypothetical protein